MLGSLLRAAVTWSVKALAPLLRREVSKALDPEPEGEPHPISALEGQRIQKQIDSATSHGVVRRTPRPKEPRGSL